MPETIFGILFIISLILFYSGTYIGYGLALLVGSALGYIILGALGVF